MKLLKNKTHIYGFEDYNIVSLWDYILTQKHDFYIPYDIDRSTGNYIINKDLPSKALWKSSSFYNNVEFEPALCKNHKGLLSTAKKLYVHPSCKLSRSMMAEKYKKSLNPFLSDAVVIPKPFFEEFSLDEVALFINDSANLIVKISVSNDEAIERVKTFKEGDKLKDLISCEVKQGFRTTNYNIQEMLDSEFMLFGELLFIPNSQSYAYDILTSNLPVDKIVFEDSVQESLGDETNQLTFDSLISIKDMLDSTDENTVAAGLKSLSMMDWMHYPNSVKFIMNQADHYRWRYNDASNSTSVKYMMNTISKTNGRRGWPGAYTDDIYEEDFELFKRLKMHYDHTEPEKLLGDIRMLNFMCCSSEGIISPRLRPRI